MAVGPYRILRRNRPLALLVAGEGLSSLADWLLAVVLTVLVYGISHSGTTVSLLTFTRLAPYALVLPWSGLALDRLDRRRLMAGLGVGRALCMLGLLLVHSSATLPLAFPLVFLSSSLSCLLRPTVNATLPDLVDEEDAIVANSIVSQVDGAAHIVGPALGGVFVLNHDPRLALLTAACAFVLSGVALFFSPSPTRHPGRTAGFDVSLGEVLAGFRYLFRENEGVLVSLTATAAGIALLAGAYYVLAVALATQTFHLGGQGVGWLDGLYGVGGLIGSLLVGFVVRGRRVAPLFLAGAVFHALGVVLLALSPVGPAPFVCIALVGMADVAVQVTATTIVQAAAPRDMLGRAFTAFESALVAAMLVGALGAGPLLQLVGPRGATLAFALAGALLLLLALPRLRSLEDALGVRAFLRGVPLLTDLPRPLLDELAPLFEAVHVPAGEPVVREGEPGDRLYIIRRWEVEASVGGQVVRRLGPAGYFGEVALLHRVPRTASVRACAPLDLFSLDGAVFQTLLHRSGDLHPRLVRDADARYLYAPTSPLLHH